MTQFHQIPLPQGKSALLAIQISARAQRISLRVVPGKGCFDLVVPQGVTLEKAIEFAQSKVNWLVHRCEATTKKQPFAKGVLIQFRGHGVIIETTQQALRRVELTQNKLIVWDIRSNIDELVSDWLKHQAKQRFLELAKEKAATIGKSFKNIKIRDTKTRWGSCSVRGNLNFSWRLIMAPDFVTDYIAAHEVAHLAHMNHSPDFWDTVAQLSPNTKQAKDWLREYGASLHLLGGC
jgi:predicted metal-dependent hydrolase